MFFPSTNGTKPESYLMACHLALIKLIRKRIADMLFKHLHWSYVFFIIFLLPVDLFQCFLSCMTVGQRPTAPFRVLVLWNALVKYIGNDTNFCYFLKLNMGFQNSKLPPKNNKWIVKIVSLRTDWIEKRKKIIQSYIGNFNILWVIIGGRLRSKEIHCYLPIRIHDISQDGTVLVLNTMELSLLAFSVGSWRLSTVPALFVTWKKLSYDIYTITQYN